jgi:hypothetical protein
MDKIAVSLLLALSLSACNTESNETFDPYLGAYRMSVVHTVALGDDGRACLDYSGTVSFEAQSITGSMLDTNGTPYEIDGVYDNVGHIRGNAYLSSSDYASFLGDLGEAISFDDIYGCSGIVTFTDISLTR